MLQVNTIYDGKAAIHMAAVENYLPIVRLLIQNKADLNVKVCVCVCVCVCTCTCAYYVCTHAGTFMYSICVCRCTYIHVCTVCVTCMCMYVVYSILHTCRMMGRTLHCKLLPTCKWSTIYIVCIHVHAFTNNFISDITLLT